MTYPPGPYVSSELKSVCRGPAFERVYYSGQTDYQEPGDPSAENLVSFPHKSFGQRSICKLLDCRSSLKTAQDPPPGGRRFVSEMPGWWNERLSAALYCESTAYENRAGCHTHQSLRREKAAYKALMLEQAELREVAAREEARWQTKGGSSQRCHVPSPPLGCKDVKREQAARRIQAFRRASQ